MRDLVIIGGGAASRAAAIYALDKQLDFLLVYDHSAEQIESVALVDDADLRGTRPIPCAEAEQEELQLIGSSATQPFAHQLNWQAERLLKDRVIEVQRMERYFVVKTQHAGPIIAGAVIVATGGDLLDHMAKIGADGSIQVDRGFATSVPGLFAASEGTRPDGEQMQAAIGDGARAARSAHFFLLTRPMARAVGQG
jgi:thioredoxin reductase